MIYHCLTLHRIGDVMVSMLSSNVEDRVFEPQSGQTNNYINLVGICCLFAKHTLLRSKKKDWLTRITIMCPSGVVRLPPKCCFCELSLKQIN
jgi:hypothetical protein